MFNISHAVKVKQKIRGCGCCLLKALLTSASSSDAAASDNKGWASFYLTGKLRQKTNTFTVPLSHILPPTLADLESLFTGVCEKSTKNVKKKDIFLNC